jgi:hypothetical protein
VGWEVQGRSGGRCRVGGLGTTIPFSALQPAEPCASLTFAWVYYKLDTYMRGPHCKCRVGRLGFSRRPSVAFSGDDFFAALQVYYSLVVYLPSDSLSYI